MGACDEVVTDLGVSRPGYLEDASARRVDDEEEGVSEDGLRGMLQAPLLLHLHPAHLRVTVPWAHRRDTQVRHTGNSGE